MKRVVTAKFTPPTVQHRTGNVHFCRKSTCTESLRTVHDNDCTRIIHSCTSCAFKKKFDDPKTLFVGSPRTRRSEMKSLDFSPAFARLDLLTNGVVLTKIDGQFRTYFCQYKGPMLSNCDVSICSICFRPISHVSIFRLLYAELEVRGLRTFGSYHTVHTHL